MDKINLIKKISVWIFILPVVVLNLCLFISVNYQIFENTFLVVDQIGRSGFTIPYIDGSVSISRVARTYPAYLLFKPGMIITAILLIKYWNYNDKLILSFKQKETKRNNFFYFGVASAFFLIAHSIFLGISFENDLYKFFRRFILIAFIIFEVVAQSLLVFNLFKIKHKISKIINEKILTFKILLVIVLSTLAIISIPFLIFSGFTHLKHALEWNYFVGIVFFYLLTFYFWKGTKN